MEECRLKRHGFTVIELLVTMSIISMILALTIPAVQRAREAARLTQCKSRLKQVVLACHSFESTRRRFPAYGGPYSPIARISLGMMSGHYEMLPYLDQQNLFQQVDATELQSVSDQPSSAVNQIALRSYVPAFVCPTDNVPVGGNSYRGCGGTGSGNGTHGSSTSTPSRRGVFSHVPREPRHVTDGLSNTVFFSERVVGDSNSQTLTPWRDKFRVSNLPSLPDAAAAVCAAGYRAGTAHRSFDGHTWLYMGYSYTQYNHVLPPNSPIADCHNGDAVTTARSLHSGGVNAAIGDGSVRFVAEHVDLAVWRALASYAGEETIGSF